MLDSKQLWAMGNYARFVRPGMKRVAVRMAGHNALTEAGQCMVSAYKDAARRQIVLVCVNMTDAALPLLLSGLNVRNGRFAGYTTTEAKALAKSAVPAGQVQLEPKSVTTLVGSYQ